MKIAWVPFATWHSWSPEERSQFATYCENKGLRLAIDLQAPKADDLQKDHDEHIDDMSIGGKRYEPPY